MALRGAATAFLRSLAGFFSVSFRSSQKKRFLLEMQRKHKHVFLNAMLLYTFRQMVERGKLDDDPRYAELLRAREIRSKSGVMVVAVFTSPYPKTGEKIAKFSCPYDCHYCPAEPGQVHTIGLFFFFLSR